MITVVPGGNVSSSSRRMEGLTESLRKVSERNRS